MPAAGRPAAGASVYSYTCGAKRLSNIAKHDLDFLAVIEIFDGRPILETRSAYVHEERFITTGTFEGRLITVVWTRRAERIRIISARAARYGERRGYRALYAG